jgi:hypothetical protein
MMESLTFVSYSRSDRDFAVQLAEDLRRAGINVWIDEANIRAGEVWDEAVQTALMSSSAVLLILSPDSVASRSVMDELSFALDKNKRVLPVLHRMCDIPFRVRRLQYIDFTASYAKGLAALTNAQSNIPSLTPERDSPASKIEDSISTIPRFGSITEASVERDTQPRVERHRSKPRYPRLIGAIRLALWGCAMIVMLEWVFNTGVKVRNLTELAVAVLWLVLWDGGVTSIAGVIAGDRLAPTLSAIGASLLLTITAMIRHDVRLGILGLPMVAIIGASVGRALHRSGPQPPGRPNSG